uniref:Uncharacterized protein n=1 Tax=Onchocerca volvulus TaxID=6282 RepID=A0A8R1XZA9_ONCVO
MARTPCLAYKIHKKSVQNIGPQCMIVFPFSQHEMGKLRQYEYHLEKIYDYYCSDSIANLLLNEESCIEKLHSIYNENDCSDITHVLDEHTILFQKESIFLCFQMSVLQFLNLLQISKLTILSFCPEQHRCLIMELFFAINHILE